ncbi:hypothetical protein GCK72_025406 [Caenorhabditis remanei]|uniref:Uncharacterized protein n=1 Tax=Caenorhabditis remanei TaxID=31234 RepID=A0A6A5G304_CAERE|nr:hypothetical protein GCK72_025406 [Caenorhabditis remanei]KAF1748939.1 hypothetical protein GCK72_025406 [Caenorhabditis remanei]
MSNPRASSKKIEVVKGDDAIKGVVSKDETHIQELVAKGDDNKDASKGVEEQNHDPDFKTLDEFLKDKIKEAVAVSIDLRTTSPADLAKMSDQQREIFFSKKISTIFEVTTAHIHTFCNTVANEGIEHFEKEREIENKESYSYSELYTLQYVARNKAHTSAKAFVGALMAERLKQAGPSVDLAGPTHTVVRFYALARLEDHFDALCKKEDEEYKSKNVDPNGSPFDETEEQKLEKKEKEKKGDRRRVSYMVKVWNSLKVENEQMFREIKAAQRRKAQSEADRGFLEANIVLLKIRERAQMENARNREMSARLQQAVNEMNAANQITHQVIYPPLPPPDALLYPMGSTTRCVCKPGCQVQLQEPSYHILTPDDLAYWGITEERQQQLKRGAPRSPPRK